VTRPGTGPVPTLPGGLPAPGTTEILLPTGRRLRTLKAGHTVSLGRDRNQDLVLPDSPYISRSQALLFTSDGHAVLRRAPTARGAMWVQHGSHEVQAITSDSPFLLPVGLTWVRMHTSRSVNLDSGQVLDPLGDPVLLVKVGRLSSAQSAPMQGRPTRNSPDAVRRDPGYPTLVCLCAGILRGGQGAHVPDAAQVSRMLASVGVSRVRGTCANDVSRIAELLELRAEGRKVSSYRVALAAVTAGSVTAHDVTALGLS
jgi:hypothetical protein